MKLENLDKAIFVPIPDTVACIVEMYWAPKTGRWVDRMVYPVMTRTIENNHEAHMGAVATTFLEVPQFNDYKHLTFYFIKYYTGTLKRGGTGIRLIGIFDKDFELFYGISDLYAFYALINKPRSFKVEPELTTINDFTDSKETERRIQYEQFIRDAVRYTSVGMLIYPEKIQFLT